MLSAPGCALMAKRHDTLTTCGFDSRLVAESFRLYPKGPPAAIPEVPGNILLTGKVGCGKTTLMAAIGRAWLPKKMLEAGCPYGEGPPFGCFTMAPMLCRELRSTWGRNETSESDVINRLSECCQLYLDDIGLESDIAGAHEALLLILKRREHDGLPSIVSTNLSLRDWRERNARTASMIGGYLRVEVGAVDRRQRKQEDLPEGARAKE